MDFSGNFYFEGRCMFIDKVWGVFLRGLLEGSFNLEVIIGNIGRIYFVNIKELFSLLCDLNSIFVLLYK